MGLSVLLYDSETTMWSSYVPLQESQVLLAGVTEYSRK